MPRRLRAGLLPATGWPHVAVGLNTGARAALVCLGALAGAGLGGFVELLVSGVDATDVGIAIGMVIGALLGVWLGHVVDRNAEARRLDHARPWLEAEADGAQGGGAEDGARRANVSLQDTNTVVRLGLLARLHQQRRDHHRQPPSVQEDGLPASDRLIRALPTHTVTAAEAASAPQEHRACTVCMEEFKRGEEQRTLPCFHRFHAGCIDRWLRTNGTCPICKHRVDRGAGLSPQWV